MLDHRSNPRGVRQQGQLLRRDLYALLRAILDHWLPWLGSYLLLVLAVVLVLKLLEKTPKASLLAWSAGTALTIRLVWSLLVLALDRRVEALRGSSNPQLTLTSIETNFRQLLEDRWSATDRAITTLGREILSATHEQHVEQISRELGAKLAGVAPIRPFYVRMLTEAWGHGKTLSEHGSVGLDTLDLYLRIIDCAAHCEKEIMSVDCAMDAWYSTCRPDDIPTSLATNPEVAPRDGSSSKATRTNLTLTLDHVLQTRVPRPTHGSMPGQRILRGDRCIRRVFIPNTYDPETGPSIARTQHELTPKHQAVLMRMKRVGQELLPNRVCNRVLFGESITYDLRRSLEHVQDIVIFDGCIAFQEHLYNPRRPEDDKGQMTTVPSRVADFVAAFEKLFAAARPIEDIEIHTAPKEDANER